MVHIVFPFAPKPEATRRFPPTCRCTERSTGASSRAVPPHRSPPLPPTPPEADLNPGLPPPDAAHIAPACPRQWRRRGNVGLGTRNGRGPTTLGCTFWRRREVLRRLAYRLRGGREDGVGLGMGRGDLAKASQALRRPGSPRSVRLDRVRCGSQRLHTRYVRLRPEGIVRSISALRRSRIPRHLLQRRAAGESAVPPGQCRMEAHRQQFFEFLQQVEPTGGTHPESAARRASASAGFDLSSVPMGSSLIPIFHSTSTIGTRSGERESSPSPTSIRRAENPGVDCPRAWRRMQVRIWYDLP